MIARVRYYLKSAFGYGIKKGDYVESKGLIDGTKLRVTRPCRFDCWRVVHVYEDRTRLTLQPGSPDGLGRWSGMRDYRVVKIGCVRRVETPTNIYGD